MTAVGIDYSMTCPAACSYNPSITQFWFANELKGDVKLPRVTAVETPKFDSVSKRAAWLANRFTDWFFQSGSYPDTKEVYIEDYAFSATGRVFHIGENAGILKYFLDYHSLTYHVIAPTKIKKFATGKGNADKNKMTAAFLEAYPDAKAWAPLLFPRMSADTNLAKSPLADLADAYWIARFGHEQSR